MNCDFAICEADIFSYMRNLRNDEFFRKIIYQDINDIYKALKRKKEEMQILDPVFDHTDEKKPKIRNLNAYLS